MTSTAAQLVSLSRVADDQVRAASRRRAAAAVPARGRFPGRRSRFTARRRTAVAVG